MALLTNILYIIGILILIVLFIKFIKNVFLAVLFGASLVLLLLFLLGFL